ncbi:MAG: glutaminyl-peptide cyclotransferase [Silvibacterium sp.]
MRTDYPRVSAVLRGYTAALPQWRTSGHGRLREFRDDARRPFDLARIAFQLGRIAVAFECPGRYAFAAFCLNGWIDLTGLLPPNQKVDGESVLNGIAYDAKHDRLFVTGRQWPTIFEIKIVKHTFEKAPR